VAAGTDIAWLDGAFLPLAAARISPLDRGFLFADAVYEVLPVYEGRVYRLEQHLERLERSLGEIRLPPPLAREAWRSLFGGLVARNGGGDLLIYVQVSRGVEAERVHVPRGTARPTVFAFASKAPATLPDPDSRAVVCITSADIRWGRCDIKSTALLANVLLKWQAQDAGAVEALLLRDGMLTEGTSSSVHVLTGGVLLTPPQTPAVLPGTTRDVLLEIAPRCGQECRQAPVPETVLRNAEEIIIASAGGGLRAVVALDGHRVGDGRPGPAFRRLYRCWWESRREFSTECSE